MKTISYNKNLCNYIVPISNALLGCFVLCCIALSIILQIEETINE